MTTETSIAPVLRAANVRRSPAEAFDIFTAEIGAWWPLPTHGMFGAEAGGVAFEDGRLVERHVDGTECLWGTVRIWEPGVRLVVSWHPGSPADEAGEVEVTFEADGDGTRVVLEHRGWEVFGRTAEQRRRTYVGPSAWGSVLDHFGDGAEPRVDAVDLAGLVAAYDAFFTEAERGDFGPAPTGEFDADDVLAHVALTDGLMSAVCQALVHGTEARFDNRSCQKRVNLDRWKAAAGDRAGLVAAGRARARQLVASVARLSPAQLETPVHCHLVDNGEVRVDQPMPWRRVAVEIQAGGHLPAHTEQLIALRPQ